MIDRDFAPIVAKLLRRTEENAIRWSPTGDSAEFLVNFGEFSVSIRTDIDREDGMRFVLIALRTLKGGKTIQVLQVDETDGDDFSEVLGLWEKARRQAMRVDEALKQIEAALDEAGGPPPKDDDVPF